LSRSNLLKFLLGILLLQSLVFAEQKEADLGVSLDYARYQAVGGVVLDVYLLVPRSRLTFTQAEEGLTARVVFQVALLRGDTVKYGPDRWTHIYRINSFEDLKQGKKIPDISRFVALAGDYTLYVDVVDVKGNRRQHLEELVQLKAFPDQQLCLSDLTLAGTIVPTKNPNEFTRYGYDVVPVADGVFSNASPLAYYFLEIYNLSPKSHFLLERWIQNLGGDTVVNFPPEEKQTPGTSAVQWEGFNTRGLQAGIYIFGIRVTDTSTGQKAETTKNFYVYRPPTTTSGRGLAPMVELMGYSLEDQFKMVKFLMTAKERKAFKNSDKQGKQAVMRQFWRSHDPDPATERNEFLENFLARVKAAERDFSTANTPGWATDRGRVLLKYNVPYYIERHVSSIDEKPWEIWYYSKVQGGVQFIFVDRTGYGDYRLVHSTAEDEIHDPDWRRWLK